MTTTTTAALDQVDTDDPDEAPARPGDRLADIDISRVIAHPNNVRADLGDLADLTRSIKNKGVLIPALVLPADADGNHALIAGHRRRAAAHAAGLDTLPVIIRELTPVEVLDTMLTENDQRSDLSVSEQIRAVARYQALAPDETPTAIGKRIGRTVRWVKDRFAVAALPDDVLDRIGVDLPLASAVALGAIIERGDDLVRECANHVVDRRRFHDDPTAAVAEFAQRHDAAAQRVEIAAKLLASGVTVFDSTFEAQQANAARLQGSWGSLDLDDQAAKAHRHEPCHAEAITLDHSNRVQRTAWCTEPKRHRGTKAKPAASEIVSDTKKSSGNTNNRNMADEKRHRQDRQDRVDAVTAALTKRVPKIDTQRLAALILIDGLDQAGRKQAAKILGVEISAADDNYHAADTAMVTWLDDHPDPTPLLAALAIGHLETRGTKSSPLSGYGDAGEQRIAAYNAWREANTDPIT